MVSKFSPTIAFSVWSATFDMACRMRSIGYTLTFSNLYLVRGESAMLETSQMYLGCSKMSKNLKVLW